MKARFLGGDPGHRPRHCLAYLGGAGRHGSISDVRQVRLGSSRRDDDRYPELKPTILTLRAFDPVVIGAPVPRRCQGGSRLKSCRRIVARVTPIARGFGEVTPNLKPRRHAGRV
jgi:hypothetical protein